MLRNEVSTLLDIDPETMRYYESRNLITKPSRLSNGYRSYNEKHLQEIKFIQHCRSLGISLDEIKTLKELTVTPSDCSSANDIIEKNLSLIKQKIAELKDLQKQLIGLSKTCHTKGPSDNCGIVKNLVKSSLNFKKQHLNAI
jgi:DNA-binding transcriptional MerR regulator